jgi:hypothetical protein
MTNEGGSIPEEFRNEYVSDRVHTVGTAFLGLTFECTRCHDHKYDPLTMKDYYALGAFFNSIDEWGTYDNSAYRPTPTLPLPTPEQERALAAQAKEVAALEDRLREVEAGRDRAFRAWLARTDLKPELPGLVGHYPLDRVEGNNRLENLADPKKPGATPPANALVAGKFGGALRFTGDDAGRLPRRARRPRPHPPVQPVVLAAAAGGDEGGRRLPPPERHRHGVPRHRAVARRRPAAVRDGPVLAGQRHHRPHEGETDGRMDARHYHL